MEKIKERIRRLPDPHKIRFLHFMLGTFSRHTPDHIADLLSKEVDILEGEDDLCELTSGAMLIKVKNRPLGCPFAYDGEGEKDLCSLAEDPDKNLCPYYDDINCTCPLDNHKIVVKIKGV